MTTLLYYCIFTWIIGLVWCADLIKTAWYITYIVAVIVCPIGIPIRLMMKILD